MKLKKREELKEKDTWDLKRLFKTNDEFYNSLNETNKLVDKFVSDYKDNLNDIIIINDSLNDYLKIYTNLVYISNYSSLLVSVDQTNEQSLELDGKTNIQLAEIFKKLVFFNTSLLDLDEKDLNKLMKLNKDCKVLLTQIIKDKKYRLTNEQEKTLSEFNQVLNQPYTNYNLFKLADMKFNSFKVNNKKYNLSFTLFENNYESDTNTELRRKAYQEFYNKLDEYKFGLANNYQTYLLTEKAYSKLKGFESLIDYQLYYQDVTRNMYDRQIDIIMEKLSPVMRKYVSIIKKEHNLDKLTYADLKIPLDKDYDKNITIEKSKKYVLNALSILGSDYEKIVKTAFKERWVDFPQNIGKSTGGFCASPYQKGSYILLNWNSKMDEVFTLAHELGHAGHFYYASKNQSLFNEEPSLYLIESPSTFNELLMAKYLSSQSNDLRFKRWVLSTLISNTYYHNMVTHLLEAAYQRKVYNLIDNNEPISAQVLNNLKLNTLKEFWKDTVEIPDYAGLTWMRQPHYFSGLYSYTYSAGLTLATSALHNIETNKITFEDWKKLLKSGGTKSPIELAKIVDVDLNTEQPLLDTINYISNIVDQIEEIYKYIK